MSEMQPPLPTSYFTCTLGEAALLNKQLPEKAPYSTVNEFIDYLAATHTDDVAVACASPPAKSKSENGDAPNGVPNGSKGTTGEKDDAWEVESLTFGDVRHLSDLAGQWLQAEATKASAKSHSRELHALTSEGGNQGTVAIHASSSLVYLITLLGWLRAGYKVLLLSHLLTACDGSVICYDDKHEDKVLSALGRKQESQPKNDNRTNMERESQQYARPVGISIPWFSIDEIRKLEGNLLPGSQIPPSQTAQQGDAVVLYGHSSGTSTGLPKPIPITNQGEIGSLPRFHETVKVVVAPSTFTATPIYTGGLADLWRSWSAASTLWLFPEDKIPITGENILRYLEAAETWQRAQTISISAPIGFLSSVPFVLQMMAESEVLLEKLQSMEMVGVGGAAMPAELGDRLVQQGVNLVSRFGSRECGFLLSSFRNFAEDKDWQYLRKHPDVDSFEFKQWDKDENELIVTERWPSLSPAISSKLPFNSHDVFRPHPEISNAWKYSGRSDVQITLITGKKFDPAGIESALCTSQWIQDAVIVGNDRQLPAAIIFISSKAEGLEIPQQDLEIWIEVQRVNATVPSHAQIKRDMIKHMPSKDASLIQKSSKGTVMRGKFSATFAETIKQLYTGPIGEGDGVPLEALDSDLRLSDVAKLISKHLGRPMPDFERSFYDEGIDSATCMQIRGDIRRRLSKEAAKALPLNVVYESHNIRGLADFIGHIGTKEEKQQPQRLQSTEQQMIEVVKRFIDAQPKRFEDLQKLLSPSLEHLTNAEGIQGRTIFFTGATGFLGAHILHELLHTPSVVEIVLPVRIPASTSNASDKQAQALQRLQSTMRGYNIQLPPPSNQIGQATYHVFPANLSSSTFGLEPDAFARLTHKVTDIIHAAWPVNFNLPLAAFASQFEALSNLFSLASLLSMHRLQANSHDKHRVTLSFVSSTASVLEWTPSPSPPSQNQHQAPHQPPFQNQSKKQLILELPSTSPLDASPIGYGQSKWVAERILTLLSSPSTKTPSQISTPKVNILRVGQLTACKSTGAWNTREAWPLMFDAGLRVMGGRLPDLVSVGMSRLGWLPVDAAARGVREITLSEPAETGHGSEEGGGPEVFHVLSPSSSAATPADANAPRERHDPTWADLQSWLSSTSASALPPSLTRVPSSSSTTSISAPRTVQEKPATTLDLPPTFIPPQTWLAELESLPSPHGAKSLLGLWQAAWVDGLGDVGETASSTDQPTSDSHGKLEDDKEPLFSTARAERASPALRESDAGRVDGELLLRAIRWIVESAETAEEGEGEKKAEDGKKGEEEMKGTEGA